LPKNLQKVELDRSERMKYAMLLMLLIVLIIQEEQRRLPTTLQAKNRGKENINQTRAVILRMMTTTLAL